MTKTYIDVLKNPTISRQMDNSIAKSEILERQWICWDDFLFFIIENINDQPFLPWNWLLSL
jgi:hypothetical protein